MALGEDMTSSLGAMNPEAQSRPWVDGLTIGQSLRETAARFPQRDALVFLDRGMRMTYQQFDEQVDRVALGLLALGFQKGHRLGIWASNVPEWVLLQFATARIGVVLVNINPSYRLEELSYAMRQSEMRGLAAIPRFRTGDFFGMLAQCCPELNSATADTLTCSEFPELKYVIAIGGDPLPGMISWDELIQRGASIDREELTRAETSLTAGDPINIQYTSGTTGAPKGATLSHRNILLNAFYSGHGQRMSPEDRICLPVPLYHCFGCVLGTLCAVVHGAAIVFPGEFFDPGKTLFAIQQERCTAIYGVPTMFISLLEHESYAGTDLSSLRTGIMAGSPCPVELMKRVTLEMGAREITIGYGQTEASPLITQTRIDDPIELRVGTVGRALPGFEVKIIDPATGRELPDGESGELCARGHGIMIGYYRLPEKTAEAIDADGWLHTGDLALREPNGYFRITGRLRDMIIRGGENIYPREIEERLYQHPAIEEVQIVGVPDRKYGEEVLAWIKLRPGRSLTESQVRDFCRARLSHFKVPHYIKFVDSFPLTVTGKIQKFKIREQGIRELGLEEVAQIETA
jgi:fatty-acyl-CoA synthase